jgi:hypothetical protein
MTMTRSESDDPKPDDRRNEAEFQAAIIERIPKSAPPRWSPTEEIVGTADEFLNSSTGMPANDEQTVSATYRRHRAVSPA